MKKAILLAVMALALTTTSKAQFAIGLEPSFKLFMDGGDMNNPALGISFINHLGDGDIMFYSGFAYGFPKKFTTQTTATAIDMFNPVQTVNVDYTFKFTNLYFDLGAGKIFGGDYEDGGFLAYGGITAIISISKTEMGSYDRANYTMYNASYDNSDIASAYGIKAGIGYLLRFGSLGLTPYGDVSLPVLRLTDTQLPVYLSFGARLNFFRD